MAIVLKLNFYIESQVGYSILEQFYWDFSCDIFYNSFGQYNAISVSPFEAFGTFYLYLQGTSVHCKSIFSF
jgi:hypothetical protein